MFGVMFQHPHYAQHLFLKQLSSLRATLGRAKTRTWITESRCAIGLQFRADYKCNLSLHHVL